MCRLVGEESDGFGFRGLVQTLATSADGILWRVLALEGLIP